MSCARQVVAAFTAVFIALAAVAVFADDADAATPISIGNFSPSGFADNSDGTLNINVISNGDARLVFSVMEGANEVATCTFVVVNGVSDTVGIKFRLGTGSHDVTVIVTGEWIGSEGESLGPIESSDVSGSGSVVHIQVDASFWSGWLPYVALVFVGLVVVLMIYIWYRGRPKNKNAISFADLEEGKVAAPAPAAETSKKKYEGGKTTTERLKYTSDRRK